LKSTAYFFFEVCTARAYRQHQLPGEGPAKGPTGLDL
jgi:hypothetical protein